MMKTKKMSKSEMVAMLVAYRMKQYPALYQAGNDEHRADCEYFWRRHYPTNSDLLCALQNYGLVR